jgi:hypothetical protein
MSTHLALVIETPINGNSVQTLIVPDFATDTCFSREYTGSRGRGSAWHTTPINTVITNNAVGTDTTVIGFTISDRDLSALKAGIVTTVGVKAVALLSNANTDIPANHADTIEHLYGVMLDQDDDTLMQYIPAGASRPSTIPFTTSQQVLAPVVEPTAESIVTTHMVVPVASAPVETPINSSVQVIERSTVTTPRVELATVPDIKWSDEYINRKVQGDLSEFDIYDQALADKANVLIKGHAGSGKTMSVMAYASARNMRFYSVSAHAGIEVSQVFGKYNPTEDGNFRWQDGGLTDCVRNGNAVLLFNEVNFLPERFTTVVFSLLDARREITLMDKDGEVVRAGDNLLIVGDMNPNYRGTRQMNQAWNDRFSQHQLVFEYDPTIEGKLIKNKALLEMANQLRARFEKDEISTPISTRSLVAFDKNMQTLGLDYAIYSYLNMFQDIERSAVSLVVETHKANIASMHSMDSQLKVAR